MKNTIKKMTLEEKIRYCTGADFWHTKEFEQYNIPKITMSDGPHGLRYQKEAADIVGINESEKATCFPAAVSAGSSWNRELYAKEAKAIGEEALFYGVDIVLGPGCNIKRNPLCGRNFEYISEDPYFAGEMAASFIKSMQSIGVSTSLKHFALNNQEYKRQNGDSIVDERAMREIYLSGFEKAVKAGKPDTVMCSYNKINGIHASDNKWLLNDVLRNEWGFDGVVVTDWGALNNRIEAFEAGCDLNMPGGSKYMEKAALKAVETKQLSESDIDRSVERILKLALKKREKSKLVDFDGHDELACEIAKEGAVLLKNEDNILPVKKEDIILIGTMAKDIRYQGSGSSHINPTKLTSICDALDVPYVPCTDKDGNVTKEELREVSDKAKSAKVAVVVAGLPESYESEALDRDAMAMPKGHIQMIEAVSNSNPNTIVVLLGGSAMEVPWQSKVKGILYMGLSGQELGNAVRDLLLGETNPSGKLTETWPISYEDVISRDTFGKKNVEYRESIYVGYRYFDKANKEVQYPFGYGLSYTTFKYSNLNINDNVVTVDVTNTGGCFGKEVVQLYVAPANNKIHRPIKELKGFEKVGLMPNETKTVSFVLDDRSFQIWNDGWKIEKGNYEICIGSSSRDICLSQMIEVDGEELEVPSWQKDSFYETLKGMPDRDTFEKCLGHPIEEKSELKKGEFNWDSTCLEMKDSSFVMKIQYKVTEAIIAKSFGGKKDYSDPAFKMMITAATDCPMRSAVISSSGAMSDGLAGGLIEMANGHYLKGIIKMIKS